MYISVNWLQAVNALNLLCRLEHLDVGGSKAVAISGGTSSLE